MGAAGRDRAWNTAGPGRPSSHGPRSAPGGPCWVGAGTQSIWLGESVGPETPRTPLDRGRPPHPLQCLQPPIPHLHPLEMGTLGTPVLGWGSWEAMSVAGALTKPGTPARTRARPASPAHSRALCPPPTCSPASQHLARCAFALLRTCPASHARVPHAALYPWPVSPKVPPTEKWPESGGRVRPLQAPSGALRQEAWTGWSSGASGAGQPRSHCGVLSPHLPAHGCLLGASSELGAAHLEPWALP